MTTRGNKDQRGSALLISLVVLTAITLVALVAMQRSSTQIRMISNLQHQHEVSNAALGTLNYVFDRMRDNSALQNGMLNQAKSIYRDALDNDQINEEQTNIPSFNPFQEFGTQLTQPSFSSKIIPTSGLTTSFKALPVPAGTNYYLKSVPGCGSTCDAIPAAITTRAQSKNNTISVTQQIGILRLVPGEA